VLRAAIKRKFGIQHPIIQGKKTLINTAGLVPAVSSVGTPGSIGCICFLESDFDLVEIIRSKICLYNMVISQRPSPLILSRYILLKSKSISAFEAPRKGRYARRGAIALLFPEFVLSPSLILFSVFQISNIHLSNVSISINFKLGENCV